MCIESFLGRLSVPLDVDEEHELDSLLNASGCPICGDKLYWSARVYHDSETSQDSIRLTSGCCGKVWTGVIKGTKIIFEEEE